MAAEANRFQFHAAHCRRIARQQRAWHLDLAPRIGVAGAADQHRVRTCPSAFTGAARQPETDDGRQAVQRITRYTRSQETRHGRACWAVQVLETAPPEINDCNFKVTNESRTLLERCDRWRLAAGVCLRRARGRMLRRREPIWRSKLDETLDAPVSNVFPAGIRRFRFRYFGSSRVALKYRCQLWCRSLYSSLDLISLARCGTALAPGRASRWAGRMPTILCFQRTSDTRYPSVGCFCHDGTTFPRPPTEIARSIVSRRPDGPRSGHRADQSLRPGEAQ